MKLYMLQIGRAYLDTTDKDKTSMIILTASITRTSGMIAHSSGRMLCYLQVDIRLSLGAAR